jgi:uncharacterized RDD family membrane protein YckC
VSQEPRSPRGRNATKVAVAPNTKGKPGTKGNTVPDNTPDYPGKRFGLPPSGPKSVAPMGSRLAALIVDWVLCYLIASGIVRHSILTVTDGHYEQAQLLALVIFAVEVYLLTAVSGLTVGKRLLRIRTIRTDGTVPGFRWAAIRTGLLLFVVPACLSDRDLRGLHDRAADTIVVRIALHGFALGGYGGSPLSAAWASSAGGRPWAAAPSASASPGRAPSAGS